LFRSFVFFVFFVLRDERLTDGSVVGGRSAIIAVSIRPETPDDEPFLRRLITDTLADQLMASAWPEPLRAHLLDIQYGMRRSAARVHPHDAGSRIILLDGQPVGWMLEADLDDEIHLVEIMILSEHRGNGIGSACLRDLLAAAALAGKPVRLRVDRLNRRAIALYERLGFRAIGGDAIQQLMERPPDATRA
jgi:ribosomal protein S18 acetylase RimI-like enzyme